MVWTIIVIDDTSEMTKSAPLRNHSGLRLKLDGGFCFGAVGFVVLGGIPTSVSRAGTGVFEDRV
jgi:hypothetical protein